MATALVAMMAANPGISNLELSLFRLVNELPSSFRVALSSVMQLGSLSAVPATAGVALLKRRPALATDLALAGGLSWVAAKALKRMVARERPALLLTKVLIQGREQGGSGFPSGHAAVAAALATVAGHHLPALAGHMSRASVAAVALARVYIGAHLPVDVLGGGGLGFTIGTAVLVRHLPTDSTS
ncbi:MAG: phosphatase PAP2 family protein [Actinomycetota bacterium]